MALLKKNLLILFKYFFYNNCIILTVILYTIYKILSYWIN